MSAKATNFWIGTAIFILLAFFGSVAMAFYAGAKTEDRNQIGTNRLLGCALWWLAFVCMWMVWATVYISQMNPLLVPNFTWPFSVNSE